MKVDVSGDGPRREQTMSAAQGTKEEIQAREAPGKLASPDPRGSAPTSAP
jgi:hypothetical protein